MAGVTPTLTTATMMKMRSLAFLFVASLLSSCAALQSPMNRRQVLGAAAAASILSSPANAFEGGVGGLGKTKPETGVVLREGSEPIQNSKGIVSAEIVSSRGNPILVEFKAPYPLLGSSGALQARDLQQPESAFVQVIFTNKKPASAKAYNALLAENIFGAQGKYGAYGSPTDVKITPLSKDDDNTLYKATFTTYTPGLRESERKILLNCQWCDADTTLVVLVAGTTLARFKSQETTLNKIATSLVAIDAPKTGLANSVAPPPPVRRL